jgi:hypothetical protein
MTKNLLKLVFTAHPTNPNVATFAKSLTNQSIFPRPKLWQEILHYSNQFPLFLKTMQGNDAVSKISRIDSWIGFDNDRHQDEQTGIFTFSYLAHLANIAKFYQLENSDSGKSTIDKIDEVVGSLYQKFELGENVDLSSLSGDLKIIGKNLQIISPKILSENFDKNITSLVPPSGPCFHYRISSEDLSNEDGKVKIINRLNELKMLQEATGQKIVSEIIIADCQELDQIVTLQKLIKDREIANLKIVPLIEEWLQPEVISQMLSCPDVNKIMLAGSDSIQRITYIGAMLMKINIQQIIIAENKKRLAEATPVCHKELVEFFEGAGSTINRNGGVYGGMLESKLNTINLANIPYQRTIQGKETEMFMTDSNHQKAILDKLLEAKGCSEEELIIAKPIIEKIFTKVSNNQINLQKEPNFTNFYNRQLVNQLIASNSDNGSRAKKPKSAEDLLIKKERAITQSMINQATGIHPELFFWNVLDEDLQQEIVSNIRNPIMQDFINHYTALTIVANPEGAKNWLNKQNSAEEEFTGNYFLGCDAMANFLQKIHKATKNDPDLTKNLLIFRSHEEQIATSYNCNYEDFNTEEVAKEFAKIRQLQKEPAKLVSPKGYRQLIKSGSLLKNQGCGFSTLN